MQLVDLRNIRPLQEYPIEGVVIYLIGFYNGRPIVWEKNERLMDASYYDKAQEIAEDGMG